MKKLFTLMLAIVLTLAMTSTAYAVDIPAGKITLTVQPVDYQDAQRGIAQPVDKTYVANERYALLISIEVPSWLDTAGMALEISPKNCTVENVESLVLENGDYLIMGTVWAPGASVKVTAKDNAAKEASTPNEAWAALYGDRSVSATATLGAAATQTETAAVSIPKTGDSASITGAALCLLLAAGLMRRRRNA